MRGFVHITLYYNLVLETIRPLNSNHIWGLPSQKLKPEKEMEEKKKKLSTL
jgi:hypothetical protein